MKKILIILCVIVIAVTSAIAVKYTEYSKNKTAVEKINKEFTAYQNNKIQINTIVSLMNKAIQINTNNDIKQDDNKLFIENETNSIKIYLEIKSRNSIIPMEDLMLGEKAGIEKVEYAFSDLIFEITDIEYHQKTGQVKKIVFTAKEDETK